MDEATIELYKVCLDQDKHIKRLEDRILILEQLVQKLEVDLISFRRESNGANPQKRLPLPVPEVEAEKKPVTMGDINRARASMFI